MPATKKTSKKKALKSPSEKDPLTLQEATVRVKERESCREVYRTKKMHVVEYPPQIRVCKFKVHGQRTRHHLAMPYMQFARYAGNQGTSLHVSFTNEPIKSIKTKVYFPPLPNVWYPSLQICLMHAPNNTFEACIKNFWNTEYLDCEDWYCFPVLREEYPMKTYKGWARMTKDDPNFITEIKWTHPCRLDQIPEFDTGGKQATMTKVGNPKYGGSHTNRFNGPIRSFAVVHTNNPLD